MDVERVLCLTSTATKDVADDICKQFFIDPQAGVFRTPVYRPKYAPLSRTCCHTDQPCSLAFEVEIAINMTEKLNRLIPFLESRTGPAIVYVTLQSHAQDVADALNKHGMGAMVYHAGLPAEKREQIQNDFMDSERGIVCATIAFGMGIDKGAVSVLTLSETHTDIARSGHSPGCASIHAEDH